MSKMNSRTLRITNYLDEIFPNAYCELNYTKDYELLIAIVLSAQTTDKRVNKVTNVLFNKYKTLEDGIKDLVDYILNNFYSKDLKTPNAIYKSYNKNITWSYKVSRYMEKLKK